MLIDAFGRLLVRDGVEKIGVNAVVREAGVGKGLIYQYFGGLAGLAQAWLDRGGFWPQAADILPEGETALRQLPTGEQIARVNVNYANTLKENPVAVSLLKAELLDSNAVTDVMKALRNQVGVGHETFFLTDEVFNDPDYQSLLLVLNAAINYLTLRADASPDFHGIPLNEDHGWQMVMQMIERVAVLFADAKKSGKP